MIGNKYLQSLFNYPDEDTSINQLLELLKSKDKDFILSLSKPVDFDQCNDEEINYLTKVSAIIDYYLQKQGLDVPTWLRNDKLKFDKPYFHSSRLSDFMKVNLQYTNPAPFKQKNVYFDLKGLERI